MSKTALILIDLQNDYFPGGRFPLFGVDQAAARARRLLDAARAGGHTVVHVQHIATSPDAGFFVKDTEGAETHAGVRPQDGEAIVVKHRINAFLHTDLKTVLDGKGVEKVVIVGAMSHMCVDAGTRAAADLGYTVTVVHDACATRDLEFDGRTVPAADVHAAFMSALAFGYARVAATDEVIAEFAA